MGIYWLREGSLTAYEPSFAHQAGREELTAVSTASDVMSRRLETVLPGVTLEQALDRMQQGSFRHLLVVDEEGVLVGVLSDRDILQLGPEASDFEVGRVMTTELLTASPQTEIRALAHAIVNYRISCLPVLDQTGTLVGIVTTFDLLRSMAHRAPVNLWL